VLNLLAVFLQGEKIQTILKAANVEVEPYWPGLFAKALEGVNVKELITNVGSGAGAAPAAAGEIFFIQPKIIHYYPWNLMSLCKYITRTRFGFQGNINK
jgi:60s Acidic ribosomal protein